MTTRIHPTALVDAGAEIGDDVDIGPFAIVGENCRIGDGCVVAARATLERNVILGAGVKIGIGSVLGGDPQDLKFKGELTTVEIGDGTTIREYTTINRGTTQSYKTTVGRNCLIMSYVHLGHDCHVGDHVIISNGSQFAGHVTVEDRATIGGLTGIHPFTRIGTYAYVGGCSKVTQDVPPFVMADGIPAVARSVNVIGMRRGGIDAAARRQVQAAFRLLYRSGMAPGAAIERVTQELGGHPLVARLVEFVQRSKRGVIPGAGRAGRAPAGALEGEIS